MAAITTVPNLFPPGPCEIAVGVGGGFYNGVQYGSEGELLYLGTTRDGGRAQEILYTGNVPADYAGVDGMPADIRLSGKGMVVVCQVQRFNPQVMGLLEGRYLSATTVNGSVTSRVGVRGGAGQLEIGSLLLTEGFDFELMIRSAYAYKSPYYQQGNQAGLHVLHCLVSGEMGRDFATREQVYNLTFLGLMEYNPVNAEWELWNNNITGFPGTINADFLGF